MPAEEILANISVIKPLTLDHFVSVVRSLPTLVDGNTRLIIIDSMTYYPSSLYAKGAPTQLVGDLVAELDEVRAGVRGGVWEREYRSNWISRRCRC